MPIYKSKGRLRYSIGDAGYRLVLEIDPGIVSLYRALIPPWITLNPQRYDPHISVVRKEVPPNLDAWSKYEGEEVEFIYNTHIQSGKVYWWLNAWSPRLEEIRLELGLPVDSPYTRPPDGLQKTFHFTIGNTKELP